MLKFCRPSSCTLYWSRSTFGPGRVRVHHGIRRWQRRCNSSNSVESIKSSTTTKPKAPRPRRIISTLDPSRLRDSDFLDLSGVRSASLSTSTLTDMITSDSSSSLQKHRSNIRIYYHGIAAPIHAFPLHTRGFLYYHRDPDLPPISGAVRFRVMPRSGSGFGTGTDLMSFNGRAPWAIWLVSIANVDKYLGLKQLLLSDCLVTPQLLEHCRKLVARPGASRLNKIHLNRIYRSMLFRLEQPFVLDLASLPRFSVMGPQWIERAELRCTMVQRPGFGPGSFFPYSGRCMVRFERSLAPEHAGKHIAVIRVLDILTPIVSTDPTFTPGNKGGLFRIPTVGSLLTKGDRPITIKADGDSDLSRCLRLLM
ncbi:hypothetical protein Hypma_013779 [Hypsizygus marmoreus]|uniref:Uncharacterized protein n=1 Tax=Hypsizygus marmoreus TaxID=39966 RepID=A0A369K7W4_HYPMA|nr:hypothetical protein Hypma_013779 [Hypsizygus marmoreus]